MARACGSYPQCHRFESSRRYHRPVRRGSVSPVIPSANKDGPLVKRLRHGPFTAVTWVRFPYGSPCRHPEGRRQFGGLAQLVRAPASHAGGHWFESSSLHQTAPDFLRNQVLFSFMPYHRRGIPSRCVHHAKRMHAGALRRRKGVLAICPFLS